MGETREEVCFHQPFQKSHDDRDVYSQAQQELWLQELGVYWSVPGNSCHPQNRLSMGPLCYTHTHPYPHTHTHTLLGVLSWLLFSVVGI